MDAHAYPEQLATFVTGVWPEGADPLPERRTLEWLLSTAYQASLLRDETRAVTFRMLVLAPWHLPTDVGPPRALHRLAFETPRKMTPLELRRIAPAAPYDRALLGVVQRDDTGFDVWGILQSGTAWLEQGSSGGVPRGALVVLVSGPGRVAVACGDETLAEIRAGLISGPAFDVFASSWFKSRFEDVRRELKELHLAERAEAAVPYRDIDKQRFRAISQNVLRRSLSAIREARHGGLIVFVTPDDPAWRRFARIKYPFQDDEARRRYRAIILSRMRFLATHGPDDHGEAMAAELAELDEAAVEMSQLIASLAAVDGAVVLTRRFEIMGFGVEITATPDLSGVHTALDLEGTDRVFESIDGVGTRHRASYRFCAAVPDAVATVVSQDGGIQFVATDRGDVIRWEHSAAGSIEV